MSDDQKLLQQLETEAEAERKQILDQAKSEADTLRSEAEQEAERRVEEARRRGEKRGTVEVDRRVGMAGQDVAQAVLEEKHVLLDSVREEIAASLGEIRKQKGYEEALTRWTAEVMAGMGEGARVTTAPADEGIVKAAVKEAGTGMRVESDKGIVGGVRAMSADGRVEAEHTLESRLRRASERLDEVLGRVLFPSAEGTSGS